MKIDFIPNSQRVHENRYDYFCEHCHKGFFKGGNLRDHLMKHVGIRFRCYVLGCQQTATKRGNLLSHLKSHSLSPEEMESFMQKLNAFCEEMRMKFPLNRAWN